MRSLPCWPSIRRKKFLLKSFLSEAAFLIKRVFRVDQDGRRYQRERNFKVYLTNSAMYTGFFRVTSQTQRPISALEIKWSDKHVDQPERMKGLIRLAIANKLRTVWLTSKTKLNRSPIEGSSEIRQWPAAALAYHYGAMALSGKLAEIEPKISLTV
jgi:uncharacterized protein